jgi:flavin reductase (NADH)/flavin reductase
LPATRFEHGSWGELATGAPVLDGALVSIDCRVAKVFDESTHHAFLCEILATQEKAGAVALLYLGRAFRRLPQA